MQTQMKTTISGMEGHKESFAEKHEEEMKKTKDFAWIFKG